MTAIRNRTRCFLFVTKSNRAPTRNTVRIRDIWNMDSSGNQKQDFFASGSLRDWLLPMLMNGQVTVGTTER